jgi:hypothetical protein
VSSDPREIVVDILLVKTNPDPWREQMKEVQIGEMKEKRKVEWGEDGVGRICGIVLTADATDTQYRVTINFGKWKAWSEKKYAEKTLKKSKSGKKKAKKLKCADFTKVDIKLCLSDNARNKNISADGSWKEAVMQIAVASRKPIDDITRALSAESKKVVAGSTGVVDHEHADAERLALKKLFLHAQKRFGRGYGDFADWMSKSEELQDDLCSNFDGAPLSQVLKWMMREYEKERHAVRNDKQEGHEGRGVDGSKSPDGVDDYNAYGVTRPLPKAVRASTSQFHSHGNSVVIRPRPAYAPVVLAPVLHVYPDRPPQVPVAKRKLTGLPQAAVPPHQKRIHTIPRSSPSPADALPLSGEARCNGLPDSPLSLPSGSEALRRKSNVADKPPAAVGAMPLGFSRPWRTNRLDDLPSPDGGLDLEGAAVAADGNFSNSLTGISMEGMSLDMTGMDMSLGMMETEVDMQPRDELDELHRYMLGCGSTC